MDSPESIRKARLAMGIAIAMSGTGIPYYMNGYLPGRNNRKEKSLLPVKRATTAEDNERMVKAQAKRERKLKRNLEIAGR